MCCCDQLWKQRNPCCGHWRHGEAFIGIIQKPSLVYGMVQHDITVYNHSITCMNWFMLCAHPWNCFFDFTHALKLVYSIHWQPVVQVQYTVNLRQGTWNDMQPCYLSLHLRPLEHGCWWCWAAGVTLWGRRVAISAEFVKSQRPHLARSQFECTYDRNKHTHTHIYIYI